MEAPEFSSHKKYKYNGNFKCCVKTCGIRACEKPSVRFYRFPKHNARIINRENHIEAKEKIDLFKAWKEALKISIFDPGMVVCSQHFTKEDYFCPDATVTQIRLRKYAVPSRNLGANETNNSDSLQRIIRTEKTLPQENQNTTIDECNQLEVFNSDVTMENIVTKIDIGTQTEQYNISMKKKEYKDAKNYVNNISIDKSGFINNIKTDAELSTLTGIESFSILNTIVTMIKSVYGNRFEAITMKIKTRDRIVLTYAKLKQNLSYALLAIMFNIYTAKHIQRIFEEMIQVLSSVLKIAIPWPSREEIRSNLPKCFEGFEDTRIVLDCTEVFIQNPKEACCQVMNYSYYKSNVTAKIMTGVSPSGTITFLSKIYGGRVSDAVIFEQSNLTKKLEPCDGIMVDRGFLIDSLCEMNRYILIRPPFLREKRQFSKEEALLTSKIAAARVHIERSNQRIKTFKIVGSVLPGNLVVLLEEIFTVISATINMSSPILKIDKFIKN